MKKLRPVITAVLFILSLGSCQDVFTTNAFFWYEADISTMTAAQQQSYAADLLASGTATTEELAEAFAAVYASLPEDLSTADPETLLLAADLAIGASGAGDVVSSALDAFTSGEELTEESGNALLESVEALDTDSLASAVALMEAAAANPDAEISSDQYANAALAQLVVVAENNGGLEGLGEATLSAEDEADLEQALAWAELGGFDTSIFGDF